MMTRRSSALRLGLLLSLTLRGGRSPRNRPTRTSGMRRDVPSRKPRHSTATRSAATGAMSTTTARTSRSDGARARRPPTRSSCSRRGRPPWGWRTSRPTRRRGTKTTSTPPGRRPRPWSTGSCSREAGRRPSTSSPPLGWASTGTAGAGAGTPPRSTTIRPSPRSGSSSGRTARSTSSTPRSTRPPSTGSTPCSGPSSRTGPSPGLDWRRGTEAGGQGRVPGVRLEDRRAGQGLLEPVHPQRRPGGDRRRRLILAHQVYGDDRFKAALRRLGDFLILAADARPRNPPGASSTTTG